MTEKRRLKRIQLSRYLNVHDVDKNELVGQVLDIHIEGFLLMHQAYLEPNCTYNLRMDLPDDIHERNHITFTAESMWTAREFEPGFHNSGFRFSATNGEQSRAIQHLIMKHGANT